jgi:hypothetical protein
MQDAIPKTIAEFLRFGFIEVILKMGLGKKINKVLCASLCDYNDETTPSNNLE